MKRKEEMDFFTNNFLLNKEEVLCSLELYLDHCRSSAEEDWSDVRRNLIMKLVYKFIADIKNTRFPVMKEVGWFYEYRFISDGIILELAYCDNLEINEVYELEKLLTSQVFELVETKCDYLSVEEYAEKYRVTTTAVRQWIRRGKMRNAVKLGRDWLIPEIYDKPERGYKAVTYMWNKEIKKLKEEFSYLKGYNSLYIYQDDKCKSLYYGVLSGISGKTMQTLSFSLKERERLELALIAEPLVKVDELKVVFVPNKMKNVYFRGEKIMTQEEINDYLNIKKSLEEENLKINTESSFCDEDGAYIWRFSSSLVKEYSIDTIINEDVNKVEEKAVVLLVEGVIIPADIEFQSENPYMAYASAWELCDSISGDMMFAYEAVADVGKGIKREIINELNLCEEDSYEMPIMFIQDIAVTEEKYLRMFLEMFPIVKEGLPAQYCKLAVVLFNWEKEERNIKIFLEYGWKLKTIDTSAVVAYKKI